MSNYDTSFRDVNWGLLAQTLNVASGILLLPIVLTYLTTEEVGLWFVFTSLAGLAFLLELGLQPTISRYVAYIYAGVQKLEKVGINDQNENEKSELNYNLLADVYLSTKKIYFVITLFVIIVLLGLGTFYISTLLSTDHSVLNIIMAWCLYSVGFIINFYYGYYVAFLHGRGDITRSNQMIVFNRLLMMVLGCLFLVLGYGLIGLGLSSLLSGLISRLFLYKVFWDKDRSEINYLKTVKIIHDKRTSGVIWHNSIKLGLVFVGAFLITRMNVLVASSFIGLAAAASYGLTIQVLMMITTMASSLYSTKLPGMNFEQIYGNKDKVLESFSLSLAVSWFFYILMVICLIVAGNFILNFIGSDVLFLNTVLLACLALVFLLDMNQSLCASYLTTHNEVSFVPAVLVSGVFILIVSVILVYFFNMGILGLIISQACIQLAYNHWKWPTEAAKKLNTGFLDLLYRGFVNLFIIVFRGSRYG